MAEVSNFIVVTPTAAPTATLTAKSTPTKAPGFEAVFAHFFFLEKRKPVLKEKLISLVKLSFLKKGLQSLTLCRGREGSKTKEQKKKKRF